MRHRFTYLTAHFAAVSKRNVHWVALKHRLNMWTLTCFYYVDISTYCCVFIMLLQKRIALLKVNALLCWKYSLHQTQPDSVTKCKTDKKNIILMQPCHFNFLICRFELLCRTVITWDSNQSSLPPKYIYVLCELPNKPTIYKKCAR